MQKTLTILFALILSMFLHLVIFQARFETVQPETSGVVLTEIGLVQITSLVNAEVDGLDDVSGGMYQKSKIRSKPPSVKTIPDQTEMKSASISVEVEPALPVDPIENASLISRLPKNTKNIERAAEKKEEGLPKDKSEQSTKQKIPKKTGFSVSPDNSFPMQYPVVSLVVPARQLPSKNKLSSLNDTEGSVVSQIAIPRYEINPDPVYPDIALRKGWEGLVLLRVSVKKNGLSGRVNIEKSSGFSSLDRAALRAVRRWKFVPAKSSGIPVDGGAMVPINFKLP